MNMDVLLDQELVSSSSSSSSSSLKNEENIQNEEKEIEKILHDLKIFASIKENEKLSTVFEVTVNKPSDKLISLKRWSTGDNRQINIAYVEKRFKTAFEKIDDALEKKEKLLE